MLTRLKERLSALGRLSVTQPQREALIDLLLLTMYADRKIAVTENEQIDQVPEELSWDSVTPFPLYVNTALARIRDGLSDPQVVEALLDDIYERLGSEAMRRRAYDACNELAGADGQVAEAEARFLERIRTRFGL